MDLIFDDDEVRAGLQRLIDRTGNIRPALVEIGEAMTESTKRRFETSTGPDGEAWLLNSWLSTLLYKEGDTPLISGKSGGGSLMNTIHPEMDGDFAVEIGSNKDQAAMMQFGGTKAEFPHLWGDIPARPYLGISDQDKAVVLGIIERHLNS